VPRLVSKATHQVEQLLLLLRSARLTAVFKTTIAIATRRWGPGDCPNESYDEGYVKAGSMGNAYTHTCAGPMGNSCPTRAEIEAECFDFHLLWMRVGMMVDRSRLAQVHPIAFRLGAAADVGQV